MGFNSIKINKLDGSLGGGQATDRIAVMVLGCGAIGSTLAIGKAYKLLQLSDAEALGITESRDAAEGRLDYYHLSEAFRLSPDSQVWVTAVASTTKVSDLKNDANLIAAIRSIDGVNTIAVAGLTKDTDITTAVTGAQLLVDRLKDDHIYIDAILLEGVGDYISGTISTWTDLRPLASPNVSVVIGRDTKVSASNAAFAKHAAVGSALGMLLVRAVHENLGSVDIETKPSASRGQQDYPLSDIKRGLFMDASLSNGIAYNKLSVADQRQLDQFGYIYIGAFDGYAGYYFSNSHTAEKSDSDYCFIERNAVWNKAARIIRKTLIPRIRSKVEANPATGYIKGTTIDSWKRRCLRALEPMVVAGNCASVDVQINEKQAAVSSAPFKIGVRMVADGVVHEFEVDLGFTNKI